METRTVRLSEDVCPIAWIIEHQKEIAGFKFRIDDNMKKKLVAEAQQRGSLSGKEHFFYIYIPADPKVEGDKPAGVTLIKHFNANENVCQWDVANIDSADIERIPGAGNILYAQKPFRGVILFTSNTLPHQKTGGKD